AAIRGVSCSPLGYGAMLQQGACSAMRHSLPFSRKNSGAMWKPFVLLIALTLCGAAFAQSPPEVPLSSTAERLYATARPRLLQIRTLVSAAGRQSSLGSGFLVSSDGLAITNYHVVSHVALEPKTYRLEYTAADGARGALTLLAIDLANDLAVVRLDRSDVPF